MKKDGENACGTTLCKPIGAWLTKIADGKRYGNHLKNLYQRFWFQKRASGMAKSLICKSKRHQSFLTWCTLPQALRGSARHIFLVKLLHCATFKKGTTSLRIAFHCIGTRN